jgi:acetylornithine deacetylase/succinyl-diaminopimelate desuccinylase-like protein
VPPDPDRLRAAVEHLQAIDRPSASEGERQAAGWIRDRLAEHGFDARVEEESATGSFTLPLGLLSALAAALGLSRRARPLAAAGALAAAAAIADDVAAGPRLLRRLLPRRATFNVVAEGGDPAAAETIVFVAHHDAARGGLIFHPGPTRWVADTFPEWYAGQDTSPRLMQLVVAGPALAGLGALLGLRGLRRAGGLMALASSLAMADIATRSVVPGANDNLAAVALLLELARLLRDDPPAGVRVLLLSTGSEEAGLEGMRGFIARHAAALPRERTRFVVLECIGGPEPILLEGEGMLRARDYTRATRDWLAACAERAGHRLRRGLRTGFATDGLIALNAGYPTGVLAAIDEYKMAPNYHSQRDVAANVSFGTVGALTEVCLEAVRSLSSLSRRAAPAPA